MELNPVFKEINRLKILSGIKGVVTLVQDPTQPNLDCGVVVHTFNPRR